MRTDQALLTQLAREAVSVSQRSTAVPTMRPGTVQTFGDPEQLPVLLDGDLFTITAQPLVVDPQPADRVMVMLVPPSGAFVVGFLGESRERWGEGGGGGAVGDLGITFIQATPATVWTIDHTLTFVPNVTVVDSSGAQVEGEVEITSGSQVVLRFSAAFAGTAYLS